MYMRLVVELAAEYGGTAVAGDEYVVTDHLGSTRLVADGAGAVKGLHDYLPFGEEIYNGVGGRTVAYGGGGDLAAQKFTGKERDSETAGSAWQGLDYFGARYYGGAQGRFTSPDAPFVDQHVYDPQSWNLYTYGRNSPIVNVDAFDRSCVNTQTVNPDGSTTNSLADDGDGKGCAGAGIKPDSKGGLSASGQQVNVYGGPNGAVQEVTEALVAFGGDGPKRIEYGPEDPFTKSFQDSIGMQAILAGVKKDCSQETGRVAVGSKEAFVNALIDGVAGGRGFYNPNAQLGAFNATFQRSGGVLNVTVTNPISFNSAAYHATSKLGIANPTAGPLGTVSQILRIQGPDPCAAQ